MLLSNPKSQPAYISGRTQSLPIDSSRVVLALPSSALHSTRVVSNKRKQFPRSVLTAISALSAAVNIGSFHHLFSSLQFHLIQLRPASSVKMVVSIVQLRMVEVPGAPGVLEVYRTKEMSWGYLLGELAAPPGHYMTKRSCLISCNTAGIGLQSCVRGMETAWWACAKAWACDPRGRMP